MSDPKISALLALSLLSAPLAAPANAPTPDPHPTTEAPSQRASARRMKHQLTTAPQLLPMGRYVGELQEKWQFPSDHIPIGMTFDQLNIVSWNVLDANYMYKVIDKNTQGLSRSMLADEHIYIGDSNLTLRDQHVVDLILQTIEHPTHPRALVALQECSQAFREELRSRLSPHFTIISSYEDSLLIDQRLFEIIASNAPSKIFANQPNREVQDVTLRRRDTGQLLRLVNAHLPGNPTKPIPLEFTSYLAKTFDPSLPTLVMGDMNFNELEMGAAVKQAFSNQAPFSLYSPYCTNISPNSFQSKAIDHFLVYAPGASIQLNRPNEILPRLQATVALLQEAD